MTSGIFDDPLAIYREYIQNAVDELSRQNEVDGQVEITIDQRQRRVSICDNGPGLTYQECLEDLVPISQSKKFLGRDRGFRGIGRLAGLAFAESVTFLTRASAHTPVTRVAWSKAEHQNRSNPMRSKESDVHDWVRVEVLDDFDYPEHFFRVDLEKISRHAAGALLNREAVRGFIAETCPVPLAPDFPFCNEVWEIFPPQQAPYSLQITLDGEDQPIMRQYGSAIALADKKEDRFYEIEVVRVPSIDDKEDAAVGWIAHSSYLGAIQKGSRVRGLRARLGNIQVGDERVFDHLFEEERFNRWCVGEVHVLDSRIVPNGRRDYFERGPHLRNLENHLAPIISRIASRCRAASTARNREKRLVSAIGDLEDMYELAASGCLTSDAASAFVEKALQQLAKTYHELDSSGIEKGSIQRVCAIEEKLRTFTPNGKRFPVSGLSRLEEDAYRRVFRAIAELVPSARSAKEIMDSALRYAKS
ncbi:MAG: ATP-binding protein [Chloroflexi bacterium]|nr:ATP-binding protein [Chloroflexota bacterium]